MKWKLQTRRYRVVKSFMGPNNLVDRRPSTNYVNATMKPCRHFFSHSDTNPRLFNTVQVPVILLKDPGNWTCADMYPIYYNVGFSGYKT